MIAATLLIYRCVVSPLVKALGTSRSASTTRRMGVLSISAALVVAPLVSEGDEWRRATGSFFYFVIGVVALLTWRCVSFDFDIEQPRGPQGLVRLGLVGLAVGSLWVPWLLLAWVGLGCSWLGLWANHTKMGTRIVKAYLSLLYAWVVIRPLVAACSKTTQVEGSLRAAMLIIAGAVILSHYFRPAVTKAAIGRRPWTWVQEEKPHHLMAASYSWGWARFLSEETAVRIVDRVRPFNRVLNVSTIVIETAGLWAYFGRWTLVAALAATAFLSITIFVTTGICFWENVVICVAFGIFVSLQSTASLAGVFGIVPVACVVVMLLLTSFDLIWQPDDLGWWSTPLTERVEWEVETISGARFAIFNNFMCPRERVFATSYGSKLCDEPLLVFSDGIVFDAALRDEIASSSGDARSLEAIKKRSGSVHFDPVEVESHRRFMTELFTRLNRGESKSVFPKGLRWLKAPGGQFYYWGDLPPYDGVEPVRRVTLRLRERFYVDADHRFVTITDRVVDEIEISVDGLGPAQTSRPGA